MVNPNMAEHPIEEGSDANNWDMGNVKFAGGSEPAPEDTPKPEPISEGMDQRLTENNVPMGINGIASEKSPTSHMPSSKDKVDFGGAADRELADRFGDRF